MDKEAIEYLIDKKIEIERNEVKNSLKKSAKEANEIFKILLKQNLNEITKKNIEYQK